MTIKRSSFKKLIYRKEIETNDGYSLKDLEEMMVSQEDREFKDKQGLLAHRGIQVIQDHMDRLEIQAPLVPLVHLDLRVIRVQ